MLRRRLASTANVFAALAALALIAAGCGPAPTAAPATVTPPPPPPPAATATTPPPAPPPAATATTPPAAAAPQTGTVQVTAVDNRFEPPHLEVAAGTTVRWTNRGQEAHDVVALDLRTFESPLLAPSESFEMTFTSPANIPYVCTLHDGMTAVLVVR